MKPSTTNGKMAKGLKSILILLVWLLLWQLASRLVNQELFLVSPLRVAETLLLLVGQQTFWRSIALSLGRIMLGFLLAFVSGGLLALLGARVRLIHDFLSPLFSVIKATPVASFIILALIWVKSPNLSTFCAFLMVVPMVYSNIYQGIKKVDKQLLEVGKVFQLSEAKTLRYIYIPSVMPFVISSCTVGIGFAWKSGVAAEVIGLPNNTIGIHLYDAKVYLQTPELFAWTFVIILLSVLIEKLLMLLIRLLDKKIKVLY